MDNTSVVLNKFHSMRDEPLSERFSGRYRGVVVETNDPLQIGRIQFKCPELHDSDLKAGQCQWAVPAPTLGGQCAGSWDPPSINDFVWIVFEKDHPYAPIWVGYAMPTRRKFYPLESIYTESPYSVTIDGDIDDKPNDFLTDYLPKDRRPMSKGWRDRYGNAEINSAVGFYPFEHESAPVPIGTDAVSNKSFTDNQLTPEVNNPDRKLMVRLTKYGTYIVQSDVGYMWKTSGNNNDAGEFSGNFEDDHDFEIERNNYYTRLINENDVDSVGNRTIDDPDNDQRRFEVRTRAGHKFEMRDVGWAQRGGGLSGNNLIKNGTCRSEYGPSQVLSEYTTTDERWVKIRSKGGNLLQFMDMGFHPTDDNFYKRFSIDEVGNKVDHESSAKWVNRDSRQIRIVTRWGIKFVLDDRGSSPVNADTEELTYGNGFLLKTRRSWQDSGDDPRGFGIEANDKFALNTMRLYSPKSKVIELNDRYGYVIMCTEPSQDISESWKYLDENEFARKIAMVCDPEHTTYHSKLDRQNRYIRFKTSAGKDIWKTEPSGPIPPACGDLEQGIESRDGDSGSGAWTEVVDSEHRGIWFSKKYQLGIWRNNENSQWILIDDKNGNIVIHNNKNGPVQIYTKKNIELIGDNISIVAKTSLNFKAQIIKFQHGAGSTVLDSNSVGSNVKHVSPSFDLGNKSANVADPVVLNPNQFEPGDRGVSAPCEPATAEDIAGPLQQYGS